MSRFERICNEENVTKSSFLGYLDAQKGTLVDKRANRELSAREAYDAGQLNLRGALRLAAYLDVPAACVPAEPMRPKTKRRGADNEVRMTLEEAMKQGLVDMRTQRFRQGDHDMSLQEAVNQGEKWRFYFHA